ncbi:hypothetical protein [Mycobacterium sp. 155]|uniref:hypothetical protein n=1 Tax=Mycobacterium sp. 155 TaxID=1157943 RepID=UPI000369E547|nr:hypothetical protein [Mycobacterium sp. 155]
MQTLTPSLPVAQPPQLSPGGRSAFRLTLIAIATLVAATTVAALGVTAWGVSTLRVITDSRTLPSTMRTLLNTTHSGAHQLSVSSDGDDTRISIAGNPGPMLAWARGGEITVSLPPDLARRLSVRTEQDLGAVIAEADLDQLTARTTEGAILLRGAARRIEVHTVDGDVATRDPIAVTQQFIANSSNGDVVVQELRPGHH